MSQKQTKKKLQLIKIKEPKVSKKRQKANNEIEYICDGSEAVSGGIVYVKQLFLKPQCPYLLKDETM